MPVKKTPTEQPLPERMADLPAMQLVQRSYWLRKEDVVELDNIKNDVLLTIEERGNIDLSAVLRGLILYASKVRREDRDEWENIAAAVSQSLNPKKRGPVAGSTA